MFPTILFDVLCIERNIVEKKQIALIKSGEGYSNIFSQLFLLFLMDKLFISDSFVSIFVLYPAPIGNVNSDESI